MARPGFATRRARSRLGQLAAFGGVVFVVAAALGGVGGAIPRVLDAGVGQLFAAASPTAATLRVQTRLDDDAAAQDRQVRGFIADAFTTAPVTVDRSLTTDTLTTAIAGVATPMLLLADPGLADRVTVTDGSWPADPREVAVQASAASALKLGVGDELTIADATYTVAALWKPRDASARSWFGDPAPASGREDELPGPVVVDESVLTAFDDAPRVIWTILPTRSALTPAHLGAYADGVTRLAASLHDYAGGRTSSVDLQGTFGATVARAARASAAAAGVLVVPVVLLAAVGGIVLTLIARSLVAARRSESMLLLARGASRPDLVGATARESVAVALVGGILGTGAAAGLLWALGIPLSAALIPLLIAAGSAIVGSAIIAVVVATIEVRTPVVGRSEGGRTAALASLGPFAAAALAAGFAVAQYLALGSPVQTGAGGAVIVDPVAIAAPVALLVTLALAAPIVAGPLFAVAERASRKLVGILPALPLRQLARRTRSVAAAVLVVALTAGAVVMAVQYDLQTRQVDAARTAAATGADLRVVVDPGSSVEAGTAGASSAEFLDLPGVTAASAVLALPVAIGSDAIPVVAGDVDALSRLAHGAPLAPLVAKLTAARVSIPLAAGTDSISVAATVTPGQGVPLDAAVTVVAWLADSDGAAVRVELGQLPAGTAGAVTLDAALPPARSLLALEFAPPALPDGASIAVQIDGLEAGVPLDAFADRAAPLGDHGEPVRVLPADAASALPVAVTEQLAARLDLAVGAPLILHPGSVSGAIKAKVAAIVPQLPGLPAGPGLFVDLETLEGAAVDLGGSVPAAGEVWVTAAHPDAVGSEVRAASPRRIDIVTASTVSTSTLVRPTVLLFWIGVAVAALLSVLGFAAVMSAISLERGGESRPLRSLGMTLGRQRRARILEGVAVAAVALVLGVLAGLLTAFVVVPGLAQVGS